MDYLFHKGYKISRLTLGTVALGIPYGIANSGEKPREEESLEMLASAISSGINCLDTARSYGTSEQLIGTFMNRTGYTGSAHVVTKFKISAKHITDRNSAIREALDSITSSLHFLRMETIPICLFHMDSRLPVQMVLKVLPAVFSELKSKQLVEMGGISADDASGAGFFADAEWLDAIQVPVNVFDQQLLHNGIIKSMAGQGKIVFARSVFLQGLFFMKEEELPPNLKSAYPYLKDLRMIAARENMTVDQVALSYVRDMEGVGSVIIGAQNHSQLEHNIRLFSSKRISDEGMNAIAQILREVPSFIRTPRCWTS